MRDITKYAISGGLIGLIASGVLALPAVLPPAFAQTEPVATLLKTGDEIFPSPINGSDFVKPERFITEDWVSSDVISKSTVRKIGYGKTDFVRIITTATGTYSTDAMNSSNIRYPGIHPNPEWEAWQNSPVMAIWSGDGWVAAKVSDANSFVNAVPFAGGRLLVQKDGDACVRVGNALTC